MHLIPGDRKARAFTAGMLDDKLYLVDTRGGRATPVFDFTTIASGGWPQLIRMTRDGKRLFITMNVARPRRDVRYVGSGTPVLLSTLDLGADAGPHYLALTGDERRLVVSDYFLNEDAFGKVHREGDHKIHVAKVTARSPRTRPALQSRLQHRVSTGPARPHGMAFK